MTEKSRIAETQRIDVLAEQNQTATFYNRPTPSRRPVNNDKDADKTPQLSNDD